MDATARKIVILGPLPPPYGGVAIFNVLLESNLRTKGCHVSSAHVDTRDSYILALQAAPDHSVLVDSYSGVLEFPDLRFFRWYLRRKKIKWVKVFHDATLPSRYGEFSILQKLFSQANAALFDRIVCVNNGLHDWVLRHYPLASCAVIPSLLPLPPDYVDKVGLAGRLSLPQPYVVTVGTSASVYGVQGVRDAIKEIRATGVNVTLVILDGGFSKEMVEFDSAEDGVIRLLRVPHQAALEIIKGAKALIRNVQHESVGLCRIEALLLGTPVIATNMGEVRFVETYNFGDKQRLQQLIVESLFSPEANSADVINFYSALADENLRKYLSLINEMK